MCSCSALRSNPPFRSAAAPLVLTAGAALLQLFVLDVAAGMHEATEFSPAEWRCPAAAGGHLVVDAELFHVP
jgi:hypothetical protein